MDNKFQLLAGCFSTHTSINHITASSWGSPGIRLYENYTHLLENEQNNIDAICVLTPTTSHKQIIIDALNLHYPVICEKTLCMNLDEAKDIAKAIKANNAILCVIYNYTGYPMVRELKAMIENNDFGKIYQIHIEMPQEGFIRKNAQGQAQSPQSWRLKDSNIPIISLDLGIHCHNLMHFLIDKKPLSIFASHSSYGNFEIIDNVNILAEYEDNISVNMWFSKCALGYRNGLKIRIFGEKLSAEWLQTNPEELLLNTQQGERIIKDRASPNLLGIANHSRYNRFKAGHPHGFIEAFANYYYDIATILNEYKKDCNTSNLTTTHNSKYSPYIFGLEESLEGLLFFESAMTSMQEKRQITLNYNSLKEILC